MGGGGGESKGMELKGRNSLGNRRMKLKEPRNVHHFHMYPVPQIRMLLCYQLGHLKKKHKIAHSTVNGKKKIK